MDDLEDSNASTDKFPAVADKLNAPKKISQFEKARQEAEIKRLKEEAEARAALREFEDSFAEGDGDDKNSDNDSDGGVFGSFGRDRPPPGPRGARGPAPGPPPSLKRKRELEQLEQDRRKSGRSEDRLQGLGRQGSNGRGISSQLSGLGDDDDDLGRLQKRRSPEPSVRKPTMLLQSLPSNTTEKTLRKLMPESLKIEDIEFVRGGRQQGDEDRTKSVLVAASAATPISEVDKAVSQMQNKYLGFGCFLKISRHVSAAGKLGAVDTSVLSLTNTAPFGATNVAINEYDRAGPRSTFKRMAPPSNFNAAPSAAPRHAPGLKVSVAMPTDLKLLKLIHKTFELLVAYGLDFEALLMAQPSVQRDEKWSWLFDSSSQAGVYYRWLIWQYMSGSSSNPSSEEEIFTAGPRWLQPADHLRYSDVCELEDIADHDDYVSSDEESGDESTRPNNISRQQQSGPSSMVSLDDVGAPTSFDTTPRYLGPYRRAKLTHFLARLPESIALLRSGDVARVTSFVVHNAGNGAEEMVDMLISNAETPFNHSVKYADSQPPPYTTGPADQTTTTSSEPLPADHSPSQLIALYLISDVLLTSATSGIRDAWKYRTTFEHALVSRRLFSRLATLEHDLKWGRLKSEQWRRKVGLVLDLWSSASVFSADSAKKMRRQFFEEQEPATKADEDKGRGSWKAVGAEDPTDPPPTSLEQIGDDSAQRAQAADKIRALKERMASTSSKSIASPVALASDNAIPAATLASDASATGPSKRSRMTAADLFDAPEEPAPERKVQSFGFSLSIAPGDGGSAAPPPITAGSGAGGSSAIGPPSASSNVIGGSSAASQSGPTKGAGIGFAMSAATKSGTSSAPAQGEEKESARGILESDSE